MNDNLDASNVDPACGNISCNERYRSTLGPPLQGAFTSVLCHAAVHRKRSHTERIQGIGYSLSRETVFHEHECPVDSTQKPSQVLKLAVVFRANHNVLCAARSVIAVVGIDAVNFMNDWILQIRLAQIIDVTVERR